MVSCAQLSKNLERYLLHRDIVYNGSYFPQRFWRHILAIRPSVYVQSSLSLSSCLVVIYSEVNFWSEVKDNRKLTSEKMTTRLKMMTATMIVHIHRSSGQYVPSKSLGKVWANVNNFLYCSQLIFSLTMYLATGCLILKWTLWIGSDGWKYAS